MSHAASPARAEDLRDGHFVIVAAQFNAAYVDGLVAHATRALGGHALETIRVPGAFEIPVVVNQLAVGKNLDAILAFAVILKGETDHADHLARSVTDALQQIALQHGIPVINAVLSLEDETQACARCLEEKINRGTEAGHAALAIAHVMRALRVKR